MRKTLLFLCAMLACGHASARALPPGSTPPDDLGRTLGGQEVRASALRGKVVVISFWATWCGYCMKEMPVLAGLQATAKERGYPLQVVEINYEEDHGVFSRAVHLLMPKLPGLIMTWDRTGALNKSFGLSGTLPTMILLHRDGTVADVHVGYDEDMLSPLAAEITRLMNEPAPPLATTVSGPAAATSGLR
ncbi:MAG TPA: TlpA disulfide reductase family protein [Rhodanobacteraceae bacterium]|nr:TlpA disulfide reductase family protein [Rhodanobacteraceae bacterium]